MKTELSEKLTIVLDMYVLSIMIMLSCKHYV